MITTRDKDKMLKPVKVRVLRSFFFEGKVIEGENKLNGKGQKIVDPKPVHTEIPLWLARELEMSGKVSIAGVVEEVEVKEKEK